jgi:serine protease
MKCVYYLSIGLITAKKFLVTSVNNDSSITNSLNNVENIHIGDITISVMDFNDFPLFLFENKNVLSIEPDSKVSISEQLRFIGYDPISEPYLGKTYLVQDQPGWNLDRIDQRNLPLNEKYFYEVESGRNVDVYVIDTGVDISHPEFQGRAVWGANFIDGINTDCNSHGTHVAGTVGSKTYGVAKNVNIVAVKVLDCAGSGVFSAVLKGFEYVINQSKKSKNPVVVNMSLGGGKSRTIDTAMSQMLKNGIHIVVAAGNENSDACNTSPASHPGVITVGATTKLDTKAPFSNWGSCVNILSPGTEILSTVPGGKIKYLQGTSMASPAVAGVLAVLLSENPTFSTDAMKRVLSNSCTRSVVTGFPESTVNCLIYSLAF